jgi:site-specific recombinase XerD
MAEKKLLDQVADALLVKHYSYRTEQTYVDWIRRYILFHNKRHPSEMGETEVQAFIIDLATERTLSASSQNQALSAILFLYRHILQRELAFPHDIIRAKKAGHLPTVLSKQEALAVIGNMQGTTKLMAQLLYGSGLRLMECLRLRVKDIDFDNHQLIVRDGKGENDRVTMLPDALVAPLKDHLQRGSGAFTKKTSTMALVKYLCLMPWTENTPMPPKNSPGNMFFQPPSVPRTRFQSGSNGIISTKVYCSAPSGKPRGLQRLINRSARIPSGIPLPPIYCRTVTTSAPSRNCLGTKM